MSANSLHRLAVGSLEECAKKGFEGKENKLPRRPTIDHDIEGGGGEGRGLINLMLGSA